MARVFGFDIGTTSIGFAVVDHNPATGTGQIHRLGVRIFPEARDPDGTPLNQQRRTKRMMRRQLRRRRKRRKALNELLHDAGLLPHFDKDKGSKWSALMRFTPYELRRRALNEPLSAHELGRALYHLAKRRHFKGRDLEADETADETPDDKKAATDRDSTLATLRREGLTLGAWLADKKADARKGSLPQERRRGIHASRAVVDAEFERVCAAQKSHHGALRDPTFVSALRDTIFFQRPVFWRKNTLGQCRFVPGAPLCPKGSWLSQQRRMLEKLNNLAIAGGNQRPLDTTERAAILEKLQTQGSMTWPGVRAALRPLFAARGEKGAEKSLKFNLELDEDSKLPGNAMEAKLADVFGEDWSNHPHKQAIREAAYERLWSADYDETPDGKRVVIRSEADREKLREQAAQSFVTDFGIAKDQAAALRDLAFPTGWEPFSTEALKAFLSRLEDGVRMGELLHGPAWEDWRNEMFPDRERPTGEIRDLLPSPAEKDERERIARLRNPTVVRTQNELRKVVNNLIRLYGKPDLIRVEVARQVGRSKREREEDLTRNRRREKDRRAAIKALEADGIKTPSRDDVEKWLLWKECGEFDPYSGRSICFDDLFRNNVFQVEHIWPRSASLDNGFGNKTLCHRDWNLRKNNRTPFEAFGHTDEWAAMKERMWKHVAAKRMAKGKAVRFCREEPLPEDFTNRQLNDTGYAARQAIAFLKRLWPDAGREAPVNVQAVTGRVTAQLRRLWKLNNVLSDDGEKTRADHRHHAIDALVVACAHPGMTQKLSRYWQERERPSATRPVLPPPWDSIRDDASRAKDEIVVSHRVRKKISGPLHDEMPVGYTKNDVSKNGVSLGIYVKRMPVEKLGLDTLTISRVEEISRKAKFVVRDERVRTALFAHVASAGRDAKEAFPPYPRLGANGPEIRKARVLVTQQKELMVQALNGHTDPANNHHIAIYRKLDGDTSFEVVSLYEAARRLSSREAVVQRHREGSTFVMSLAPGDALAISDGESRDVWIVQGVWANGQIVLEHGNDAAHATTTRPNPATLAKKNAQKVAIDPIGRVRPAHD